jgi:hypothetical protein
MYSKRWYFRGIVSIIVMVLCKPALAQQAVPEIREVQEGQEIQKDKEATTGREVSPPEEKPAQLETAETVAGETGIPPGAPPIVGKGSEGRPESEEPENIRGQILSIEGASMVVKTGGDKKVSLVLPDNFTVIILTKGSYTRVDFGVYVGAVAVKMDQYSPIVRDSLSWLHKGFELRLIDEKLRGIALGHKKWDLTNESIIAHGWVDDIEGRVISIKYGPTEFDETDVETPRDVPVHNMSLGDKSMIKAGKQILAGYQKGANGDRVVSFIFVGQGDNAPGL